MRLGSFLGAPHGSDGKYFINIRCLEADRESASDHFFVVDGATRA